MVEDSKEVYASILRGIADLTGGQFIDTTFKDGSLIKYTNKGLPRWCMRVSLPAIDELPKIHIIIRGHLLKIKRGASSDATLMTIDLREPDALDKDRLNKAIKEARHEADRIQKKQRSRRS